MLGELIVGGIGIISTGASAWISYFLTRKKYNAEVDNSVIVNLEKSLKFYEELSTHNQEKLKELMEENKSLRNEIEELRKQLLEISTNLYLDSSYQNRVKTREIQIANSKKYVKTKDRLDKTENNN